jgi:hypothetical protein
MLTKIPFPPFALSKEDAVSESPTPASRPARAEADSP